MQDFVSFNLLFIACHYDQNQVSYCKFCETRFAWSDKSTCNRLTAGFWGTPGLDWYTRIWLNKIGQFYYEKNNIWAITVTQVNNFDIKTDYH